MPRKVLPLFLISLFCCLPRIFALDVPENPGCYVVDEADVLSESVRNQLENQLNRFEKSTSVQLVVATFSDLGGEPIEDFSIRLAEKWKIGQRGKDNGALLLIIPGSREVRIETGYGLEAVLPDILAGRIIQNEIIPHFREKRFDQGILAGVNAMMRTVTDGQAAPQADSAVLSAKELLELERESRKIAAFFISLIAGLFVLDLTRYFSYARSHRPSPGGYSFIEWWFRFAILCFLFQFIFRMIFYSMLYSRGGYYGSRGGYGGFRGSGGSFGGGGASGRW